MQISHNHLADHNILAAEDVAHLCPDPRNAEALASVRRIVEDPAAVSEEERIDAMGLAATVRAAMAARAPTRFARKPRPAELAAMATMRAASNRPWAAYEACNLSSRADRPGPESQAAAERCYVAHLSAMLLDTEEAAQP